MRSSVLLGHGARKIVQKHWEFRILLYFNYLNVKSAIQKLHKLGVGPA